MVPQQQHQAESQEVGPLEYQNSQSTVVSGVELFSRQSSVATEKATPSCKLQGTSRNSKLKIESGHPKETQEDHFRIQEFLKRQRISEQAPTATKERENTVEQEDENDEVGPQLGGSTANTTASGFL